MRRLFMASVCVAALMTGCSGSDEAGSDVTTSSEAETHVLEDALDVEHERLSREATHDLLRGNRKPVRGPTMQPQ